MDKTSGEDKNDVYPYAVLGIFFDTDEKYQHDVSENEQRIIDEFFDSMRWGSVNNAIS